VNRKPTASGVVLGQLALRIEIDYRRRSSRRLIFPFYFHSDAVWASSAGPAGRRAVHAAVVVLVLVPQLDGTVHGMLISLAAAAAAMSL